MATATEPRPWYEVVAEIIRTSGLATLIVCGLLWWLYHDVSPRLLDAFQTQTETQRQQAATQKQQADTLDRLTTAMERQAGYLKEIHGVVTDNKENRK